MAPAYEAAKAEQDKATEASTANYAKKRSMLTEVKHFKEQRDEVRQWEKLQDARVSDHVGRLKLTLQDAMIQRHLLWRLYHLRTEINESTRQVEEANDKLTDLRATVVSSFGSIRDSAESTSGPT